MPRPTTLKEIDQAGYDLRLWCYACQRAGHIDAIIWERFAARGLPLAIDAARPYFPCRQCGARDCLILPATRRASATNPAEQAVAAFFHLSRGLAKRPYESPAIDRAIRALLQKSRNSDLEKVGMPSQSDPTTNEKPR